MNIVKTHVTDTYDAVAPSETNDTSSGIVDVLIAGAGIGGLVSALCLRRAGFSVLVCERAQILEPVGYGLGLQPYAVKLLYELGLEHDLSEIGIPFVKSAAYSRNGQFVYEAPRGTKAGYNWPSYLVRRGDFQQVLFRHLSGQVGGNCIRLSQKLVAFRSQSNHVEVDFVNPTTGRTTTELAKVLVGADGINSAVRMNLYPDEGPPLWRGVTLWRGLTQIDKPFLDEQTTVMLGHPRDRFFNIYPLSKNLVNWGCMIQAENTDMRVLPMPPDWSKLGNIEDLFPLLSDMKLDLDFLDIRHLIKSSMMINTFPICDREPVSRWTHGLVTLLGDAAHPMYPSGGHGASQAILDARGLVLAFRQHGVTSEGLQAYEDLRRDVANAFVLAARESVVYEILKIVDDRAPSGFRHLSDVISPSETEAIFSKHKELPDLNPQRLNVEPPLF